MGSFLDGRYHRILNDYNKIGDLIMSSSIFILFSQIPFKENKIITYIGSRTINIYYIHMIIVGYAYTYILPYFIKFTGTKLNLIRTILVLIISIGITEILKKVKLIKKYWIYLKQNI